MRGRRPYLDWSYLERKGAAVAEALAQTLYARTAYRVAQSARMAWFGAHYAAAKRLGGVAQRSSPTEPVDENRQQRAAAALARTYRELFVLDRKNVEAGRYLPPPEATSPPRARDLVKTSLDFFRDSRRVGKRKEVHGHSEVLSEDLRRTYPRYYLQNFHYQSDGWLSEQSARRYDMQVETLFGGAAGAMRRQALPYISEALEGRDMRQASLLDLACGTAPLLAEIKANFPLLNTTALDLSPHYLEVAKRRLRRRRGVNFVHANAEHIPLADQSQDIVTAVYLFHELPPRVRSSVAAEIARVLKPGGVFLLVDALQLGDEPDLDLPLERFPEEFHEPYYAGYVGEDTPARMAEFGFAHDGDTKAFLTKVSRFRAA